jgi:hypothetical protein
VYGLGTVSVLTKFTMTPASVTLTSPTLTPQPQNLKTIMHEEILDKRTQRPDPESPSYTPDIDRKEPTDQEFYIPFGKEKWVSVHIIGNNRIPFTNKLVADCVNAHHNSVQNLLTRLSVI